ncbi:MAG: cytochrome-c peroxidase [Bacteroidetes bacterium]|nr:cytochrome-c peroxidase [Bacteroidota bacterium]
MLKYLLILTLIFLLSCNHQKNVNLNTEADLGKALFFDPILSSDKTISCASCHKPELAYADSSAFSKGVNNQTGSRNTPSAMNVKEHNFYFWDGRSETLEEQAKGPIENPVEMNLPLSIAVKRVKENENYTKAFYAIYKKPPSIELISKAIAAFENTLETGETAFDAYMLNNDTSQFGAAEQRGREIFNTKARCFDCHFGPDFNGNDQFKNIGFYNAKNLNDKGRYDKTKNEKDLGAFKIPGLRNISVTAPYMHHGALKTLREVIDYYDNPNKFISNSINRDTILQRPLNLSKDEKKDLEKFLYSLTDKQFLLKH